MDYKKKFRERRSGKNRRGWNEFVTKDNRSSKERRSGNDRRKKQSQFKGPEKRKVIEPKPMGQKPSLSGQTRIGRKKYLTTQEVADRLGLTQTTLTLWIRNKMIDDSKIKRDASGRRLWTEENVQEVRRVKKEEGWA